MKISHLGIYVPERIYLHFWLIYRMLSLIFLDVELILNKGSVPFECDDILTIISEPISFSGYNDDAIYKKLYRNRKYQGSRLDNMATSFKAKYKKIVQKWMSHFKGESCNFFVEDDLTVFKEFTVKAIRTKPSGWKYNENSIDENTASGILFFVQLESNDSVIRYSSITVKRIVEYTFFVSFTLSKSNSASGTKSFNLDMKKVNYTIIELERFNIAAKTDLFLIIDFVDPKYPFLYRFPLKLVHIFQEKLYSWMIKLFRDYLSLIKSSVI